MKLTAQRLHNIAGKIEHNDQFLDVFEELMQVIEGPAQSSR